MAYELVKSRVVFDSENHTYTLDGKQLSGITSLLSRQLFKDKYDQVPEQILKKAANRGTMIHQSCELLDEGFSVGTQEAQNYQKIKERYNLVHEESEYLVSDNEHYASCIDKVFRYDDTTFFLGDIKTIYTLDKEYVQWQLSIYAYLFEKQNPGARVTSIFAIWLRGGTYKLVELDRLSDEKIERLLLCDSQGLQYNPNEQTMPVVFKDSERLIVEIETQMKQLEQQKKTLHEGLLREMVRYGLYQYKGENVSITRKTASTRKSFDKERFEKDYPGVYENYIKDTPVSESILIKVR